jgi:hypothetical protein
MKKLLLFILLSILVAIHIQPQEKDSLIQLYPGLGDTVDSFNASYFELFSNIKGFEHALFYIRNNQRLVSKVTYSENGKTRDTTFIQLLSALDNARKKIAEIEKENEKKYESPREFIIETKNGTKYICEIEMYSKDEIYFNTEETVLTSSLDNSRFKFNHSDIVRINLSGEKNTLSCMGYGALVGLGVGLVGVLAFSSGKDSEIAIAFGLPFITVVGGLGGLIFGLASPSGDEEFIIDYQYDLLQLKPFVKYYFRYDESVEEQYVEIE